MWKEHMSSTIEKLGTKRSYTIELGGALGVKRT